MEIIRYLKPELWWIENPRTGLLTHRSFMKDLPYVYADYCQYSMWGYRKPTRFWGSVQIVQRGGKICDLKTCPNAEICEDGRRRHKRMLGGYGEQISTWLKGRVPSALVDHLLGREKDAPPCSLKKQLDISVPGEGGYIGRNCGRSQAHVVRCGNFCGWKSTHMW